RAHVPRPDVAPVVDQHVDAAETADGSLDRGGRVTRLQQVERDDEGGGAERARLARGLVERPGQRIGGGGPHGGGMLEALRAGDGAGGGHEDETASSE